MTLWVFQLGKFQPPKQNINVGKDGSLTLNGKKIGTVIGDSFNNMAGAVKSARENNLMVFQLPYGYVVYAVKPEQGCEHYFKKPSAAEKNQFYDREPWGVL